MTNRPYWLLLLAPLIWAGNTIAGKLVAPDIPPMILTFFRWLVACIILAPLALPHVKKEWAIIRAHLPVLFFYGAVGFTSFNLLLYAALHHTTAINVSILQAGIPMLILLLSTAFFGQRIFALQILGVIIAFLGVALTATDGRPGQLFSQGLNRGDAMMLLACLAYAVYSITLRFKPNISWLSFIFVLAVSALMVSMPFALYEINHGGMIRVTPSTILIIIYIALFPSIIAQLCYAKGVSLIGASRAGFAINLIPVFGALMSVMILGEALRWYHIAGLLLVFSGIALSEKTKHQQTQQQQTNDKAKSK